LHSPGLGLVNIEDGALKADVTVGRGAEAHAVQAVYVPLVLHVTRVAQIADGLAGEVIL
jgi:hypothetical protein